MTTRRNTSPKILIVDDQPDVLGMLRAKFQFLGYQVTAHERGLDAVIGILEAYKSGYCFDAMILDCALPHLDGFSIARIVRLVEKTEVTACRAWIAVYTAFPRTVEKSTLVETSGVDAYFVKGSDDELLADQIVGWLKEVDLINERGGPQ